MEIQYSNQALKFLGKQDAKTRQRIESAIERLPKGEGDIKKMTAMPGYRLRVGDYRVLFDIYGRVIWIDRILPRGQAYKHRRRG